MINQHFVCYVTGGLRSGKGLFAVRTIEQFLLKKRRVVTNFDLYLENLLPHQTKNIEVIRIPDRPNIDDLECIGQGYDSDDPLNYDESKFGLIALDELGTWFNSRDWNSKGRREIIDWLIHSGKRRWCLLLTIQDLELLDKQAREATANQLVAKCMRLGNIGIPFITPVVKLITGYHLTLPDLRLAVIRAGSGSNAFVSDRIVYKGTNYYRAYNTRQEFYPRESSNCPMVYSYLSPWHLKGRYKKKIGFKYIKKWCSENAILFIGFSALSTALTLLVFMASLYSFNQSAKASQQVTDLQPIIEQLQQQIKNQPIQQAQPIQKVDCSEFEQQYKKYFITASFQYPKANQNVSLNGNSLTSTKQLYLISDTTKQISINKALLDDDYYKPINNCKLQIISKNSCQIFITCEPQNAPLFSGDAVGGKERSVSGSEKQKDTDLSKSFISDLLS